MDYPVEMVCEHVWSELLASGSSSVWDSLEDEDRHDVMDRAVECNKVKDAASFLALPLSMKQQLFHAWTRYIWKHFRNDNGSFDVRLGIADNADGANLRMYLDTAVALKRSDEDIAAIHIIESYFRGYDSQIAAVSFANDNPNNWKYDISDYYNK